MTYRVAFRLDSSPLIGSGHLMRCLVLAKAMRVSGIECVFICRDFGGNFSQRLVDAGFEVRLIADGAKPSSDNWLGVSQAQDVQDTITILDDFKPDWFVVDHYSIDDQWVQVVASHFSGAKILVLDDLANRKHHCDILVDIGANRSPSEYANLLPSATICLTGTQYAILDVEFAKQRDLLKTSGASSNQKLNILVSFGGGDSAKYIEQTVDALQELATEHEFSVSFIGGFDPTEKQALSFDADYLKFTDNMAEHIAKADIVIGAAGGTSWERCCLGKPSVFVTVADNQIDNANALEQAGAGIWVKSDGSSLKESVSRLLQDESLQLEMSAKAFELCDGRGAKRVLNELLAQSFQIQNATILNAQFIYDARYGSGASKYYRYQKIPEYESHVNWLQSSLTKDSICLLNLSLGNVMIAHLRMDFHSQKKSTGEISIYISTAWRGRGIAKSVLKSATTYLVNQGITKIFAEVHPENYRSINMFETVGYRNLGLSNIGFLQFLWTEDTT